MHGKNFTPEEISAEVLKKLKRDAEAYFGGPVTRAVITVPAYFNDAQRNATKRAGELAGFAVERIVNEPTAAALAYGLDKLKEKSKVAVYDLGGGTFDLSILELNEGVFQVLATNGNTCLGGDDLDRWLVDFLLDKIAAAGGDVLRGACCVKQPPSPPGSVLNSGARLYEPQHIPVQSKPLRVADPRSENKSGHYPPPSALDATRNTQHAIIRSRLREAAEQAKIKLSTETETEISLPFLTPDFSFRYRLTRAELEDLTRDLIARTRPHCLRALADAKLTARDLDQVILVGGQTRMPLVRQYVSDLFSCTDVRPQLNTSQNPDEAVALGAAIQAEILSGGFQQVLLLDVTPLSLGLETFGGLMNVLIPRNSTIPVKAGEMFTTAVDGQRSMLIHVLQGERERARDNWSLGQFTLEFEPAPRGLARVGVQFEIDANGILHVLARDVKTGREKIVELKSAVNVDDAAVQQMIGESVEHAFSDLASRRWIEAKLRAQATLAATRQALAGCAGEIEAGYRREIEAAAQAVENALATEDAASGAGEVPQLQAALAALDEITKPLADTLMDQAMETLLRQRGLIQ